MKVVLFGATGMIGQAVLRECLLDPGVERVLAVVRSPTGQSHEKLDELVHRDFLDFSGVEARLAGHDACFWCLGVTSAGRSEEEYRQVTVGYTVAAAQVLARVNPAMTFVFVSGTGADASEKGRVMWARVKGAAENAVLAQPFRASYVFRPAFIQPRHGITSRTPAYRAFYAALGPLFPLLRRLFPRHVTTSDQLARAMIRAARHGAPTRVLEGADIVALAA